MEAEYYEKTENGLRCHICPKSCLITEGKIGFCGVRKNEEGKLILLNYPHPCTTAVDPIEKKPLYHFHPGKPVFSIATVGCNLACKHCQNVSISKAHPGDFGEPSMEPEKVVDAAEKSGSRMIAFTYTEPTIFFEYMRDIAKIAKERGLLNVMVSNGYISPEPLRELLPLMDAANIDLKAFDDGFYRKICSARLGPVLDTLKMIREQGVWLEVTNLIIPTLNDSPKMIQGLIDWVADELGKEVPLHFSRFHPDHLLSHLPMTPVDTLENAYRMAKKRIEYVYIGNLMTDVGRDTRCHSCDALLIKRSGFGVKETRLSQGNCPECGTEIPGKWR